MDLYRCCLRNYVNSILYRGMQQVWNMHRYPVKGTIHGTGLAWPFALAIDRLKNLALKSFPGWLSLVPPCHPGPRWKPSFTKLHVDLAKILSGISMILGLGPVPFTLGLDSVQNHSFWITWHITLERCIYIGLYMEVYTHTHFIYLTLVHVSQMEGPIVLVRTLCQVCTQNVCGKRQSWQGGRGWNDLRFHSHTSQSSIIPR